MVKVNYHPGFLMSQAIMTFAESEEQKAKYNSVGSAAFFLCPKEMNYDDFLLDIINCFAGELGMKYCPQLKAFASKVSIAVDIDENDYINEKFREKYNAHFISYTNDFGNAESAGYLLNNFKLKKTCPNKAFFTLPSSTSRSVYTFIKSLLKKKFGNKDSLAILCCRENNIFTIIERK